MIPNPNYPHMISLSPTSAVPDRVTAPNNFYFLFGNFKWKVEVGFENENKNPRRNRRLK